MYKNFEYPIKLFLSLLFAICCITPSARAAIKKETPILSTPITTSSSSGNIQQSLLTQVKPLTNCSASNDIIVNIQFSDIPNDFIAHMKRLNIKVISASSSYNLASVILHCYAQLKTLAQLNGVLYLTKAPKLSHYGIRSDNHVRKAFHLTELVKQLPNLTGKGIRIGIISDSFAHSNQVRGSSTTPAKCKSGILQNAKNQLSGDLPARVDLVNDACTSSYAGDNDDEGAAMAEVIHDIAPDATLLFDSDEGTDVSMVKAINTLCTPISQGGSGADIVVDDTQFVNSPVYQTGIIGAAAQKCVQHGVMYFTAAGNNFSKGYQFTYHDINPNKQDPHTDKNKKVVLGNDFHKWPNGTAFLPITVPPGSHAAAVLNWNQPYISYEKEKVNYPLIDFDMYLFEQDPKTNKKKLILSSTNKQGKGIYNNPVEYIGFMNVGKTTDTYYLAINHWSGNTKFIPQDPNIPVKLDLHFVDASANVKVGLKFNYPAMYGHSLSNGIISVAAMPWYGSTPYIQQNKTYPEFFSSSGGLLLHRYFDLAGNVELSINSGPTLTGIDGENTSFYGTTNPLSKAAGSADGLPYYYGTSAAAPSVAAVAALLKQYAGPHVPNSLIREALVSTASDVTAGRAHKGWDPITGAGEVNPLAAWKFLKRQLAHQ